ncbi:50S ribosomal protein L29 [Candidatus Bathyarchaeota archaeon RBG_13_52_12]|nr:MAG: 50S ribosomal protein L29 [Candidatus Bathyarchaeota archaeon RBG_13_52_12]
MPIVRLDEVREMTSEQRLQKITELKTELSKIRTLINAGGSVENPGRSKAIRKAIARIETVIHEEAFKQ